MFTLLNHLHVIDEMGTITDNAPFTDLPQALVEEMFSVSQNLAKDLAEHISLIEKKKDEIRTNLKDKIKHESEIIRIPKFPTTAGVDGSYTAEKLLATDMVAMAAVAVEGLVPPKLEEPIWPRPRHFVKVESLAHDEGSLVLAKAIMMSMEIQLAALAPHDVVFLDGSMTTLTIAYNQALGHKTPKKLVEFLLQGDTKTHEDGREKFGSLRRTLEDYKIILAGKRADRITVAIPKYSRRNEISESIGLYDYDDRGLLSLVLSPGEFTSPTPLVKEGGGKWLTSKLPDDVKDLVEEIENLLSKAYVAYYKPYKNFPAIRMEMGEAVAKNDARMATLLEGIKLQSGTPGMMEPYPTYLADKMVKHLSTALPAMKSLSVSEIASEWSGNLADVYLATHSYRS